MSSIRQFIPVYTVADYQHWKGDWELWNGVAIAMTPSPFGGHQRVVSRLAQIFLDGLDKHSRESSCSNCGVYVDLDWIVSNDTVVRPDLIVDCGDWVQEHLRRVPSIAVEVRSPSTAQNDSTYKFRLYEEHAVGYYIMVDPISKSIEFYGLVEGKFDRMWMNQTNRIAFRLKDGCTLQADFTKLFH